MAQPPTGAQARLCRIAAVIPCFGRQADLSALLGDLALLARDDVAVTVVDNASQPPLCVPRGVRLVRAEANLGGSGGFNIGLSVAFAEPSVEFFWLLDSDARLRGDVLTPLIEAIEDNPDLGCVGSALADPATGRIFEAGSFVDRRTGEYVQRAGGDEAIIRCDYVPACSMLIRREALRRAGLMPDVFVSGDDVGLCLAIRRAGMGVAAVRASVALHPSPDKMRTWARYYAARNPFANIDALGLGARVRFVRAMREVARAVCQTMIGRDDLAALHLAGLRDAAHGRATGPASAGTIQFEPFRPWDELDMPMPERAPAASGVFAAMVRLLIGPRAKAAVVSARGRASDWMRARTLVIGDESGFVIRHVGRLERLRALAHTVGRGFRLSWALARRAPKAPAYAPIARPNGPLALSIIVLSYNRLSALKKTLESLVAEGFGDCVTVIDNGSTEHSPRLVRELFPSVRVIELGENLGVEAFNRGARDVEGDVLLILDDDAVPDRAALDGAMALLEARADVAAVSLHPVNARTGQSEWAFAREMPSTDEFPFMGCANLVRAACWRDVGGYEAGFFLYRNDTDLAMTLLDAGRKVHFDPAWVARHDSPAHKSDRWFETATRNWMWMMRRHGRGPSKIAAMGAGWLWAHRVAGLRLRAHGRVLKGVAAGVFRPAPALPSAIRPTGWSVRRILAIRFAGR